jgi:replication-associated recombination protein RarA
MTEIDWSQKYRPSSIEDVILPEVLGRKLKKLVNQSGGLSLLFFGKPGCGKTTVGRLINPNNTLYINCTADNSINMVRELERKCSSVTLDGSRRVVLLDEADYLSKDAQAALRGVVESLSVANDFVMTANAPWKLSDAIRSRFFPVCFDFDEDMKLKTDLKARLCNIAHEEGYTEVADDQIFEIVEYSYPDVRKMLKSLQFQLQFD